MKKKNEVKKISLAYLSGFVVLRNYENAPFLWFEVYFFRKCYECFFYFICKSKSSEMTNKSNYRMSAGIYFYFRGKWLWIMVEYEYDGWYEWFIQNWLVWYFQWNSLIVVFFHLYLHINWILRSVVHFR